MWNGFECKAYKSVNHSILNRIEPTWWERIACLASHVISTTLLKVCTVCFNTSGAKHVQAIAYILSQNKRKEIHWNWASHIPPSIHQQHVPSVKFSKVNGPFRMEEKTFGGMKRERERENPTILISQYISKTKTKIIISYSFFVFFSNSWLKTTFTISFSFTYMCVCLCVCLCLFIWD